LAQIQKEILSNDNNKIIKKYRKVASSIYPLGSLNNILEPRNAYFTGFFGSFYVR